MDATVERQLRTDRTMARLIDTHGPVTVEPAENEFRRLCVSIINQQLSTASAAAIRTRVFGLLDDEVTPQTVLAADETALLDAGLSTTKAEYLRSSANAFLETDLTREGLSTHSDTEVVEKLTQIRGVGEWTARMYLIFVLGREDVLPLGDLAVRRGFEQVYADGDSLARDEMRAIADRWRPYRSYGTQYLWAEYESK